VDKARVGVGVVVPLGGGWWWQKGKIGGDIHPQVAQKCRQSHVL